MDFSHVFDRNRWQRRFESEAAAVADAIADGRVPDATVDEVGVPHHNVGFDGRTPIQSRVSSGYGTGDPSSPGWAGWGGG